MQWFFVVDARLSLSRPFFAARSKPAQLRVVILDASASMQATDESPTRFEKARSEALKWDRAPLESVVVQNQSTVAEILPATVAR